MNAWYIIKRYAKSKRSWNFEIGPKVEYGLYVYDSRYISKMSWKKNRAPPPLNGAHAGMEEAGGGQGAMPPKNYK